MIASNTPPHKSQRNREWLHGESMTVYRWSGNAWRDPFGRPFIEPLSKPIMDEEDAVKALRAHLEEAQEVIHGFVAMTESLKQLAGCWENRPDHIFAAEARIECARQLREAIKEGR